MIFSEIKHILNGAKLPLIYDAVDSPNKQLHVDHLSPNGTLLNAMAIQEALDLKDGKKAFGVIGSVHFYESLGLDMYKKLGEFLEKKIIKVSSVYPKLGLLLTS